MDFQSICGQIVSIMIIVGNSNIDHDEEQTKPGDASGSNNQNSQDVPDTSVKCHWEYHQRYRELLTGRLHLMKNSFYYMLQVPGMLRYLSRMLNEWKNRDSLQEY